MPTTNKRINLTIPDDLYKAIQKFKQENYIGSDSAACLQLIRGRLDGLENAKTLFSAMKNMTPEQLALATKEGVEFLQNFDPETSLLEIPE